MEYEMSLDGTTVQHKEETVTLGELRESRRKRVQNSSKRAHVWCDPRPTPEGKTVMLYAVSFPTGNHYDIRETDLQPIVANLRKLGFEITFGSNVPLDIV